MRNITIGNLVHVGKLTVTWKLDENRSNYINYPDSPFQREGTAIAGGPVPVRVPVAVPSSTAHKIEEMNNNQGLTSIALILDQ